MLCRDSGTFILSGVDEVQVLLDDHIMKTTTMKSSPFVKPFENEIMYFILIYFIVIDYYYIILFS